MKGGEKYFLFDQFDQKFFADGIFMDKLISL